MSEYKVIVLIAAVIFFGLVIFIYRDRRHLQNRLRDGDELKASARRALKAQQQR